MCKCPCAVESPKLQSRTEGQTDRADIGQNQNNYLDSYLVFENNGHLRTKKTWPPFIPFERQK